jgi:hypothetical protein
VLVSYNVNTFDFADQVYADIYRPRSSASGSPGSRLPSRYAASADVERLREEAVHVDGRIHRHGQDGQRADVPSQESNGGRCEWKTFGTTVGFGSLKYRRLAGMSSTATRRPGIRAGDSTWACPLQSTDSK